MFNYIRRMVIDIAVREIAVGRSFLALSSDEKPQIRVSAGALLKETDTLKDYIFDGDKWVLKTEKAKTLQWMDQVVPAQSYFSQTVACEGFDIATAFIAANGNSKISFRVTDPQGNDYSWDPLGSKNQYQQISLYIWGSGEGFR